MNPIGNLVKSMGPFLRLKLFFFIKDDEFYLNITLCPCLLISLDTTSLWLDKAGIIVPTLSPKILQTWKRVLR